MTALRHVIGFHCAVMLCIKTIQKQFDSNVFLFYFINVNKNIMAQVNNP